MTPFESWLVALEARHLADLTPPEVTRALRALSSCYVERRDRLARGGALDTAGKRAAFALFYAPLHFVTMQAVVSALAFDDRASRLFDLGCGTGSAGAAWAIASRARIAGFDRNPWAVAEANWTYRQLSLPGTARQKDVLRVPLTGGSATDILAAYLVNELPEPSRTVLLPRLLEAHRRGARVLIVEPIARRLAPWWAGWERAFLDAGGRGDEWRFPAAGVPSRQRELARAAGLGLRELTARTLALGGRC